MRPSGWLLRCPRWFLLVLWYFTGGCTASISVGPFLPHTQIPCDGDPACPPHYECRFPGVDARAICMPTDVDDVLMEH